MVDMPVDRMYPHMTRGYAYVEFETPEEAEKALKHMDGGEPVCFCSSASNDYSALCVM